MKVVILSASPNKDGLTAACAVAASEGIQAGGGTSTEIRLNDLNMGSCEACDNGWGTCKESHICEVLDDFQAIHAQVNQADAVVIVTPVYYGETSESTKVFLDRLRRCEATRKDDSALSGKPVIAVAAAGGSGNGMITCLLSLERWIEHVRARKFDLLPVNRWSREYKLVAIQAAAQAMVEEAVQV